MNIISDLFLTFARIGAFTFGGGYAMIALIEDACVTKKQWITHEEMMQMIVIAESTPGPIAINCATYVGYKKGKFPGAAAATLGMVMPSFLILYIISLYLDTFLGIRWIASAFKGIRAAVGLLIADAAVRMFRKTKPKGAQLVIMTAAFSVMLLSNLFYLHISSIVIMLCAAVVSLALYAMKNRPPGMEGWQNDLSGTVFQLFGSRLLRVRRVWSHSPHPGHRPCKGMAGRGDGHDDYRGQ